MSADATQDRVQNRRKLMERAPIGAGVLMGRGWMRPDRARWHILDENGNPLCGRLLSWEIADQAPFADPQVKRVCNPCHGKFSWQPMPHEYVLEDHGMVPLCKIWPRGNDTPGYGIRGRPNRKGNFSVHRDAYEQAHGPIPDGFVVHHLCGQKMCFEPAHLEAMSRADHIRLHGIGGHHA